MADTTQNNKKFLDYVGLAKFWELIKSKSASTLNVDVSDNNGATFTLTATDGVTVLSEDNIPVASASTAGLMTSGQFTKLENMSASIEGAIGVKGVKVNGNDTTVDSEKKVNIDLAYDSDNKQIQIVDLNNNSAVLSYIEVDDFVKDGLLTSSDVVEKDGNIQLQLDFTYADGTSNSVFINVNDLVTLYEAGDGLQLISEEGTDVDDDKKHKGTFKVVAASKTYTVGEKSYTDNYVKVDSTGVYTTNIASDIDAAKNAAIEAAAADATSKVAVAQAAANKAQSDATKALGDAAAAQAAADKAQGAADNAQGDATQALSDAAAAQSTADTAVQNAADAQAAANKAQSDATKGISDAAAAQATANKAQEDATKGINDAAAAQADATQALSDAAAAQADATKAIGDAAAAQAAADKAQAAADKAQGDAAAAQATADKANQDLTEYKSTVTTTLGDYATKSFVETELKDYYTSDVLDGKFTEISNNVTNTFKDYATTAYVNEQDAKKVDKTTYEGAVKGITDRLTSIEGIKHIKDITYAEADKKIYLTNTDGDIVGDGIDVSDFVVDGFLDSVSINDNNELVFVFTTGNGFSKQNITVDLKKYIDVYSADETSLTLDSTKKQFSLKAAAADKVNISSFTVGGTVLGEQLKNDGITEISADNLQSVLESLFSQNIWPSAARSIPSALTVSMNNPSITFDKTGTQEVGTTINVTAAAATASASANITYSGFDYGYALNTNKDDNGKYIITSGNPSKVACTGVSSTTDYKLEFKTMNGFNSITIPTVNSSSLSATEMKVVEGTNKISVKATSPKFSGTAPAQSKYYYASSLGRLDEDHTLAATNAVTVESSTIARPTTVDSVNASVTGAYKFYIGWNEGANNVTTSEDIKKLATTAWSNGNSDVNLINAKTDYEGGGTVTVAIPAAYKIKSAINSLNFDGMLPEFSTPTTVSYVLPDGTNINYKVYNAYISASYGWIKLTIGK